MGSIFDTWNGVTGAIYPGAGGSWEHIWLYLSSAMCVGALWFGHTHEKEAYEKAELGKGPRA